MGIFVQYLGMEKDTKNPGVKKILLRSTLESFRGDISPIIKTQLPLTHANIWDLLLNTLRSEHQSLFKNGHLILADYMLNGKPATEIKHSSLGSMASTMNDVAMSIVMKVDNGPFRAKNKDAICEQCRRHGIKPMAVSFPINQTTVIQDTKGDHWTHVIKGIDDTGILRKTA